MNEKQSLTPAARYAIGTVPPGTPSPAHVVVLPAPRYSLPNLCVPEQRRSGPTALESEEREIVALVRHT